MKKISQQARLEAEQKAHAERLEKARQTRERIEKERLEKILNTATKQMQLPTPIVVKEEINPDLPIKYAIIVGQANALVNVLANYYDFRSDNTYIYEPESTHKRIIVNRTKKIMSRLRSIDTLVLYIGNTKCADVELDPTELMQNSVGKVRIFSQSTFPTKYLHMVAQLEPLAKVLQSAALTKDEPQSWGDVQLVLYHYSAINNNIKPQLQSEYINIDFDL